MAQLRGELPLPWEGALSAQLRDKLGVFKEPVLQLLQRDPARRASMQYFSGMCRTMFMIPPSQP